MQGGNTSIVVSPYIVSDSAFGPSTFMMRSYPDTAQPHTDEHAYNDCHIRTRRFIENVFGRLKNRFTSSSSSRSGIPVG